MASRATRFLTILGSGWTALVGRLFDLILRDPLTLAIYDDTGYLNFGDWGAETRNAAEASQRLVGCLLDELGSANQMRLDSGVGRVLDAACGAGGTTRQLVERFGSSAVTAINITDKQLALTRERAPNATVLKMDATDLDFPEEYFDVVLCVEAAFCFDTRRRFLQESRRVLAPGGQILLTDILYRWHTIVPAPPENHLDGIRDYQRLLEECGFIDIHITEIPNSRTWTPFVQHFIRTWWRLPLVGRILRIPYIIYYATFFSFMAYVNSVGYLHVRASKVERSI